MASKFFCRRIYQPRGRVWGGSSSLNAMVYIRGHAYDYDRWEKEGAKGWSYADCLPYFRKSQTHELGKNFERNSPTNFASCCLSFHWCTSLYDGYTGLRTPGSDNVKTKLCDASTVLYQLSYQANWELLIFWELIIIMTSSRLASQMSWVWIPFKPEFF